jgi:hypothetical protein
MTETVKAPTPAQVDALVNEYAQAQSDAAAAATAAAVAAGLSDEVKQRLVAMVKTFGFRHTEKSLRLAGNHNRATITTGTRTTVDAAAVEKFRTYLGKQELTEISGRFFVEHVSYSLVEGPQEVLKTLSLGKRIRDKAASLIALCFQIKTNAPSLKIETVTPVAP